MKTRIKSCKYCGKSGHYTSFCPWKPKKPLSHGVVWKRWSACKEAWFKLYGYEHPCHYCGVTLAKETITLDHKISRGRAPELRYDFENLVPCCFEDNQAKGSLDHDEYIHECMG